MSAYQGKLDALCGMYAICNALEVCQSISSRAEFETSWDTACAAIPSHRLHDVLKYGTFFSDLKAMLKAVIEALPADRRPTVSFPFENREKVTDFEFRKFLVGIFEGCTTSCIIVKLNFPVEHWLVGVADGSRLVFTDSMLTTNKGKPYRKNIGSLATGSRRSRVSDSKWVIDRRDFAVLERG